MILAADSELCKALLVENAFVTREARFVGDTDDGVLPWAEAFSGCYETLDACFD